MIQTLSPARHSVASEDAEASDNGVLVLACVPNQNLSPMASLVQLQQNGRVLAANNQQRRGRRSPVAVSRPRHRTEARFHVRVLPANSEKNREPTSGIEPLTSSH